MKGDHNVGGKRSGLYPSSVDYLDQIDELPDPFLMNDGTRVASRRDWAYRREEIKELILRYQYGHVPPKPRNMIATDVSENSALEGTATERHVVLKMGPGHAISIRVGMVVPEGSGPFPVILINDRQLGQVSLVKEIVDRGYVLADYVRHDLDRDDADRSDGVHPIYPDYDWGTLAAWAWGGMRVLDYLVTLNFVDREKIAFTGHSRGGKTALLAGALDERIAIVAPNGSGTGGAGSYRIQGQGAEKLEDIMRNFPYWFHKGLRDFIGRENRLPFDQHFLRALVAPRAIISTDALGDLWANPLGTQHAYVASQPVYDWLGSGERNAIHFREGGHEQGPEDWRAFLDFADFIFFDRHHEGSRFDLLPFPNETKAFNWTAP